jgi:hypothetical protein
MAERLDVAPLVAWLERRAELNDGWSPVEARCGVEAGSLRRMAQRVRDGEQATVKFDYADELLTRYGDGTRLEDLWPDEFARAADDLFQVQVLGRKVDSRGRDATRRRGVPARLSDEQLRAAHRLHIAAGLSVRELGRRGWQAWGYATPKSAATALSKGWRRLGLFARDRIEATVKASTVHGHATRAAKARYTPEYAEHRKTLRRQSERCAGVRTQYPRKGERCSRPALIGSEFCWAHDPAREAERVAHLERARSRLAA